MNVRVTRQIGTGGQLLEEGRRGCRVAGEQGLGHGEADAAIGVVVLAAVAPVGEVAFDGLGPPGRAGRDASATNPGG